MARIRRFILITAMVVGLSLLAALFHDQSETPRPVPGPTVDSLPFLPVVLETRTPVKTPPYPGRPVGRALRAYRPPPVVNCRTRALDWLVSRQREDGSWEGPLRRTGLAVLAFLSCGETHKHGAHKREVRNALKFLRACQGEDGIFRQKGTEPTELDQVIATLAAAEAWNMTASPLFKKMAEAALDALADIDTLEDRTKPWAALVIQSALTADVALDAGAGLHSWYDPKTKTYDATSHAAGVLCLAAAKHSPDAKQLLHVSWPSFLDGMGHCFAPRYLYFGSRAMFSARSAPGTHWSRILWAWQDRNQQEDGSFLPDPRTPGDLGRVGATALMVMARSVSASYSFHVIEGRPR